MGEGFDGIMTVFLFFFFFLLFWASGTRKFLG